MCDLISCEMHFKPFLIPSDIAEMQSAANGMIIPCDSCGLEQDHWLFPFNSVYLGSKGPQDEDTGLPSNGVPIKIHMNVSSLIRSLKWCYSSTHPTLLGHFRSHFEKLIAILLPSGVMTWTSYFGPLASFEDEVGGLPLGEALTFRGGASSCVFGFCKPTG